MLVIHRPFFANASFSTPFYSSMMARSVCLGAARETILLSHKVLVVVPSVQHWSCYYHRVLAATLVVLASSLQSPLEERSSFIDLCSKSVEIFRSMPSSCPKKGISLVERALAQMVNEPATSNLELESMGDFD